MTFKPLPSKKQARQKEPKCWLLSVRVVEPDFRVAHLLRKLGMRPSKFKANQYVVGYALDCRPLLEWHRDRLRQCGLKPRDRRVKDWTFAPKGNPIDRAVARHAELMRIGKAPPTSIPSEPRAAMSPIEFARQWISARKAGQDEQKRDAQPATVKTVGPARSLDNGQSIKPQKLAAPVEKRSRSPLRRAGSNQRAVKSPTNKQTAPALLPFPTALAALPGGGS